MFECTVPARASILCVVLCAIFAKMRRLTVLQSFSTRAMLILNHITLNDYYTAKNLDMANSNQDR
jgi:hypothetical protein